MTDACSYRLAFKNHLVHLRLTVTAGYWEEGGYHMRGDPWLEERFR
jgi:DMSO/TMAO reductase YedYZ molybdopterin-dependent catalytic subunit